MVSLLEAIEGLGCEDGCINDFVSFAELSEVQQQLAEINNRYNLLGARISDRQSELDSIKEELRKHLEHFRSLSQFLDKIQRMLPKETIPQSKEDADKMAKSIKVRSVFVENRWKTCVSMYGMIFDDFCFNL